MITTSDAIKVEVKHHVVKKSVMLALGKAVTSSAKEREVD
jgi:hypothetical protein